MIVRKFKPVFDPETGDHVMEEVEALSDQPFATSFFKEGVFGAMAVCGLAMLMGSLSYGSGYCNTKGHIHAMKEEGFSAEPAPV